MKNYRQHLPASSQEEELWPEAPDSAQALPDQAGMSMLSFAQQLGGGGNAFAQTLLASQTPEGANDQRGPTPLSSLAARASAPLPERQRVESALSADLGHVRVALGGEDVEAALASRDANAAAIGDKILFASDQPDLSLIAHEASHVLQQGGGDRGTTPGGAEEEAELAGHVAESSGATTIRGSASRGTPQFDLRDSARDQNDKRRKDAGYGGKGSQHPSFVQDDGETPQFTHDHGFLDDGHGNIDESKREDPTIGDYASLAAWTAKLEAAEALRPDLVDATSAYRHFLFGGGATRTIDYQRFIDTDSSGATVLASAMEDAQNAATAHHDALIAGQPVEPGSTSFSLRTGVFGVGNDGRYPYPSTENWQKAIGAHQLWLELQVCVEIIEASRQDPPGASPSDPPSCTPTGDTVLTYLRNFNVDMIIHMEDMYNFNPGNADIATGTPDAANGRFEVTGLGHEYLNTATLDRSFDFEASMDPVAANPYTAGQPDPDRAPRTGRPADRRPYPTTR